MFRKVNDYEVMSINYDGRVFVLVAKTRATSVNFTNEFLAVGECINTGQSNKRLSYIACKTLESIDLEFLFEKEVNIFNKNGITFIFDIKNKEFIMSFFNKIPFFI